VIRFQGGSLEVAGRLLASGARFTGSDWDGIVLKGCDSKTVLRDSTIEGARTGLLVLGGAPLLDGLLLANNDTGMELRQKTAATVRGSTFRGNRKVGLFVKDDATASITGNRFENNGKFGAYIYRALPAKFSGNSFSGQPTALSISHFGSDPRIDGNRFEKNELAILVDRAARPVLAGNELSGNGTGVRLYRRADARLEGNRLTGNEVGIVVAYSSYPHIGGNDLAGNGTALRLEFQSSSWEEEKGAAARETESSGRSAFGQAPRTEVSEEQRRPRQLTGRVDARDNWWGMEGTKELVRIGAEGNPSFIHDGRDEPFFVEDGQQYPLDRVLFEPWRQQSATVPAEKKR
jgi:parallel beta-helix repeat protein